MCFIPMKRVAFFLSAIVLSSIACGTHVSRTKFFCNYFGYLFNMLHKSLMRLGNNILVNRRSKWWYNVTQLLVADGFIFSCCVSPFPSVQYFTLLSFVDWNVVSRDFDDKKTYRAISDTRASSIIEADQICRSLDPDARVASIPPGFRPQLYTRVLNRIPLTSQRYLWIGVRATGLSYLPSHIYL